MRNTKKAALWGAPLSLALLLAACSDDDSADDATTTTTTTTETTTSEPSSSSDTSAPTSSDTSPSTAPPGSATTTPPPSSDTTAPAEDESEAGQPLPTDPEGWASELIRAWGAGDRPRALELAAPEAVDVLFGLRDPGGDDWDLDGCDGAAGTLHCTFSSASLGRTVETEQSSPNGTPAPIRVVTVDP